MRSLAALLMFGLTAIAGQAGAGCDPATPADAADIAAARAAVAASCPCDDATSHGEYVRCAAEQASAALQNPSCLRVVKRCAARSTCGRPGAVTCCRTSASGTVSCAVKHEAAKCRARQGGTACVGGLASCCDACGPGGCVTTTTTTTTLPPVCGNGVVEAPEMCDGTTCPLQYVPYPDGCEACECCARDSVCYLRTFPGQIILRVPCCSGRLCLEPGPYGSYTGTCFQPCTQTSECPPPLICLPEGSPNGLCRQPCVDDTDCAPLVCIGGACGYPL